MDRHQPDQALLTGRPHDQPQREMDLAGRQRDERALHGVEAAGRIEELLDVRFVQHQDLAQAGNSRIARTATKEIRMAFELPSLPYDHAALEPHIDAQTMEIHHGKHHQAYVDNANKALDGTQWADAAVEEVLRSLDDLPEDKRTAVRNNAGGHANHSLFWQLMSPDGGGEPSGALADAIGDGVRRLRLLQGDGDAERRHALRLRLDLARLERLGPRGVLDRQPGLAR